MSIRNVIQQTFDEFGTTHKGRKKSGSWYLSGSDTLIVLNLQKSNYSPRYYINFGIWFLAVGPSNYPKTTHCHLQTRLEALVADDDRPRLEGLLNLEEIMPDHVRHDELHAALDDWLLPFVQTASSLSSIVTAAGHRLLANSLLDRDGQRILARLRRMP
ncbi:DUF4304 domain-containing protein [Arthrobacter globiformis]|uniref:DUF4304 domain-containing protein n=1 Tax=Arthrobacter globiformis TaxID=1665 RepID=UPI00397993DF